MNNNISSRLFYPNPFQPTGIEFTLEESALVTVKILDSSGKEVETLIENHLYSAGEYVLPFDSEKYLTGKYWYQITVNIGERNFIETKQIL